MHFKTTATPYVGVPANAGKNKNRQIVGRDANGVRLILRVMKLTSFILLTACLTASAAGFTQTVSLSVKNAPLGKVFEQVKKQTGYSFMWDEKTLKDTKPVSLELKNATIQQVLDLCIKNQPITYSIIDKLVLIKLRDLSSAGGGGNEQRIANSEQPLIDITGRVTDADGNPLAGANVKVKGTNNGTTTNNDGVFVLKGVDENATLEISYVGYETYTVSLSSAGGGVRKADGGGLTIVASLKVKPESLNEVVINKGYYNTKRATEVGSVSTVTAKDIEKQPVNNPLLALEGRVPGMVITQANGLPGSGVKVQIRGQNSISKGTLPLYIIDGVPYINENVSNLGGFILGSSGPNGNAGGNPLSFLNPSDIEAIDVLKDADATAIYGSRGANGVVLITTKRGRVGKMAVDVNVQSGWGKIPHFVHLLNTRQYLDMRYEALRNDGVSIVPSNSYDLKVWDTTRYTDWQKEFIGGTAHYNKVQANLSGGTKNTQYLIGAGYHKETTVFPNDFNNQQGSLHFNLNSFSNNQKFHFLFSTDFSFNENKIPLQDLTGLSLTLAPDAPAIYNPDGTLNWANSTWSNPLAVYLNKKYKSETYNLVNNAVLSYQIIKGLEIKSSFGYTRLQTDDRTIDPASSKNPAFWATSGPDLRKSSFLNNYFNSWIIEPQITYTRSIGRGVLSALIGTTIQQTKSYMQQIDAQGFNNDLVIEDLKSASILNVGATSYAQYKYNALFGRINYNWREKYILNLTTRRDGTSRFGPANRFHNFGAVGAGWIFSKEKFIENNLSFLSFAKLRASYGTTGNDQVGDYTYLDLYNAINVGIPYEGTTGIQLTRHYTPDLAWEETKKEEIGLDLSFWDDRINIGVDYYFNTSSNQLVAYTLPYSTGFNTVTKNLDAKVENKGWEVTLNTINISTKNLRWTSSFNVFWNRNELASVAPGMSSSYTKLIGHPLNSLFLYQFGGVNDTTGQYQFIDSKGNITYTPSSVNDKTTIKDINPQFAGGFQNSVQFHSIQLDIFFQFVKQNGRDYLYNYIPGYWNSTSGNQPITVLDRWQKVGDITNIQRFNQNFSLAIPYSNALSSDQTYSNISFARLKNLSLSWQLPEAWKRSIHIQNGRIYAQGQNLFTLTKYKGFDPESLSTTSLPPLRVITFGAQITF